MATKSCRAAGSSALMDTNRVNFNWGYHDGAADQRAGRVRSTESLLANADTVPLATYVEGYSAGVKDARSGLDTSSSERAWLEGLEAGTVSE